MRKKDVKRNLLDHSEAKVNLLGEYINRYLNIICNDGYTPSIEVYDLFCGAGKYEDGGEGSPLVIMRAVKDVHFKNVAKRDLTTKMNAHFNDVDAEKIANVEKSIRELNLYYADFGTLDFSSIDYEEYLKKLIPHLKTLGKSKAFVFIDPYRYKNIRTQQIRDLMSNGKTECLLWLPTQFMYRFEKDGTPTALKDFIEEIVPFEEWKPSTNVWDFVEQLKYGFQQKVGTQYYVETFTIQKDNNTVYCLFFFTSHIKGFEKMLESKWEIDTEHGKGWDYTGNQPSLFHAQKTNPLAEALKTYLREKPRTNGEIYEFTLRQGYLPKHTVEVFTDWQNSGQLEVTPNDQSRIQRGWFYINYKRYDKEFSKVTFRLK